MVNPAIRRQVPPFNPLLALALGAMAISTGAIFARLAEAPPLVIAAYRVGLATVLLAPFAFLRHRQALQRLTWPDLRLALLSGAFLAGHFATWISSLNYTSVANSVVLVNTNPIWVGLLTPLVTGDRVARATVVGIGVSVAGGLVIGAGDLAGGGGALVGDALALAGSLCAAAYILIGRNLRRRLSLVSYILLCYGSAAVFLWLAVLGLRLPVAGFSGGTWAAFWGMAIVAQLVGHTSFNWALRWFSAGAIAVALLGEPIGATILAYLIFGEGLTVSKVVGGGMILAAIWLASSAERNRAAAAIDS
jgi:drug/metabolite transporter (DMT)-like permease